MCVDPSDLLTPPFAFGESRLLQPEAKGSCECFENEEFSVPVVVRKQGDWVNVNIPNIFGEVKRNELVDFATIKISPFLPKEFLGNVARKRLFGGLAKVFELETGVLRVSPAIITMEEDGTITVNPANKVVEKTNDGIDKVSSNNFFFSSPGTVGSIGTFNINFTYMVDDMHNYDSNIKLTKLEREKRSIIEGEKENPMIE